MSCTLAVGKLFIGREDATVEAIQIHPFLLQHAKVVAGSRTARVSAHAVDPLAAQQHRATSAAVAGHEATGCTKQCSSFPAPRGIGPETPASTARIASARLAPSPMPLPSPICQLQTHRPTALLRCSRRTLITLPSSASLRLSMSAILKCSGRQSAGQEPSRRNARGGRTAQVLAIRRAKALTAACCRLRPTASWILARSAEQ